MALHISNPETERNVRAMAAAAGEPITEAVNKAAIERIQRMPSPENYPHLLEDIYAILREVDALPRLDYRSADEIIGYDEDGLPA